MATETIESILVAAQALLEVHREDEAVARLAQAIASSPEDPRPRVLIARCLVRLGQPQDALQHLDVAVRVDPESAIAFVLRSEALLVLNKRRPALAAATEAIRQAPHWPAALIQMSSALGANGRATKALAFAEEAVRLAPNDPATHNAVGIVALRLRRWTAAEAAFRAALEIDPQFAPALHNLALVANRLGRGKDAHALFAASAQAAPRSGASYRALVQASNAFAALAWFSSLLLLLNLALWLFGRRPGSPELSIAGGVVALAAATGGSFLYWRERSRYHPRLLEFSLSPWGMLAAVAIAACMPAAAAVVGSVDAGARMAGLVLLWYFSSLGIRVRGLMGARSFRGASVALKMVLAVVLSAGALFFGSFIVVGVWKMVAPDAEITRLYAQGFILFGGLFTALVLLGLRWTLRDLRLEFRGGLLKDIEQAARGAEDSGMTLR